MQATFSFDLYALSWQNGGSAMLTCNGILSWINQEQIQIQNLLLSNKKVKVQTVESDQLQHFERNLAFGKVADKSFM